MHSGTIIRIPLSKNKIVKLLIFSLIFVAAGLWILIAQPQTSNFIFNNVWLKNIAGGMSTIMGIAGTFYFSRKLADSQPGLVIDNEGFTDNSSAVALGKIYWRDVIAVEEKAIQASIASKQYFVTILLKNPETYINRYPDGIRKKMMLMNLKYSGTPVNISANSLKISFTELKQLLQQQFDAFRNNQAE